MTLKMRYDKILIILGTSILLSYLFKQPLFFVGGVLIVITCNWKSFFDTNEGLRESPTPQINCNTDLLTPRTDDIDITHLPYHIIWDTVGYERNLIEFDPERKLLLGNNNSILMTLTIQNSESFNEHDVIYIYKNKDVKLMREHTKKYVLGKLTDAGIYNVNAITIAESTLLRDLENFGRMYEGHDSQFCILDFNGSTYWINIHKNQPHTDRALERLYNQIKLFARECKYGHKIMVQSS